MIIAVIQIVGVPLFFWLVKLLTQIKRGNKYQSFQIDALVDVTSKQFGNGEFRKRYDNHLKDKMEKHNFIYKG